MGMHHIWFFAADDLVKSKKKLGIWKRRDLAVFATPEKHGGSLNRPAKSINLDTVFELRSLPTRLSSRYNCNLMTAADKIDAQVADMPLLAANNGWIKLGKH